MTSVSVSIKPRLMSELMNFINHHFEQKKALEKYTDTVGMDVIDNLISQMKPTKTTLQPVSIRDYVETTMSTNITKYTSGYLPKYIYSFNMTQPHGYVSYDYLITESYMDEPIHIRIQSVQFNPKKFVNSYVFPNHVKVVYFPLSYQFDVLPDISVADDCEIHLCYIKHINSLPKNISTLRIFGSINDKIRLPKFIKDVYTFETIKIDKLPSSCSQYFHNCNIIVD